MGGDKEGEGIRREYGRLRDAEVLCVSLYLPEMRKNEESEDVMTETMTASEYRMTQPKQRASKYKNIPTYVGGIRFASKREARRYCELKLLQEAGEITCLTLQAPYPFVVEGVTVGTYKADFVYVDVQTGRKIVEDAKGRYIEPYPIKKKLMKACYDIDIVEV